MKKILKFNLILFFIITILCFLFCNIKKDKVVEQQEGLHNNLDTLANINLQNIVSGDFENICTFLKKYSQSKLAYQNCTNCSLTYHYYDINNKLNIVTAVLTDSVGYPSDFGIIKQVKVRIYDNYVYSSKFIDYTISSEYIDSTINDSYKSLFKKISEHL